MWIMKSLKLTLLLMGGVLALNAQEKTDIVKENLHGKVKTLSVTGYTVERINGKLQKGRAIHTATSEYNDKGYLLEFKTSGGDDTIEEQYVHFKAVRNTYNYDNNGILVSNSRYNGNGTLEDSAAYKVDSKGNRIDWNTYK